jgi:hypothetical protein
MSDEAGGYGPPKLESYSVEIEPPKSAAAVAEGAEAAPAEPRVKVILRGSYFIKRAMMLIIKIGDVWVKNYHIMPDQRTIVCFLDEIPEEGAPISIGYGGEDRAELPGGFTLGAVATDETPSTDA